MITCNNGGHCVHVSNMYMYMYNNYMYIYNNYMWGHVFLHACVCVCKDNNETCRDWRN